MSTNKKGKGFKDTLKKGYAKVLNTVFKNPYKTFQPGEIHIPQAIDQPNGKLKWVADTYSGPGSQTDYVKLLQQYKTGTQPQNISKTTPIALRHDINYGLARNADDIRKADLRMIKDSFGRIDPTSKASIINGVVQGIGIGAKVLGEKVGIFGGDQFTNTGGLEGEQREAAEQILQHLDMRGEGHRYKRLNKKGSGHIYGTVHNHRSKQALINCKECMQKLK